MKIEQNGPNKGARLKCLTFVIRSTYSPVRVRENALFNETFNWI